MSISIIICLLITLLIVYTAIVKYTGLKNKWEQRTSTISIVVFYIGRLDENIKTLVKSGKLDNDSKEELMKILSSINNLRFAIRKYEQDNF